MSRPDVDALKTRVLALLEAAEDSMTSREIANSCGLAETWTVREVIRRLKAEGHNIISSTNRGYWLLDKGPLPRREPKFPVAAGRLGERGERCWDLNRLTYPVDLGVLEQLLRDRGVSLITAINEAAKKYGAWPEGNSGGLYRALRDFKSTGVRRRVVWRKIWALAQVLGVPPEMLVDEVTYIYRGAADIVPDRFAGYKLLFGVLREGLHPFDIIPPFWSVRDRLEDMKARPLAKEYRVAARWVFNVYKGFLSTFKSVEGVLYACTCAKVSPAELFVGYRQSRALPLQAVHFDLAVLPEWDLVFLAAVARLLRKARSISDAALISELSLLVQERSVWREKFEEKKGKRAAAEKADAAG